MIDNIELLRTIEKNARLSAAELATMLGASEAEVEAEIKRLKDEKIILGYTTEINWEKTYPEHVTAMIEVRITPVKNKGYDHIAQILSKYDKVTACYLMSGGFDLMIIYEDRTLRDIATFVTEKIATMEGVLSTTTHFILKKYKANGIIYDNPNTDDRQAIIL
jgi:DNA-binding Lrp family transcriptional regulator